MYPKDNTKTEIGKVIREAIRAARRYRKEETPESQGEYNKLFETIYTYFYRQVYGMVKVKINLMGTEEDVEELCNDIFMEIRENLHKFK